MKLENKKFGNLTVIKEAQKTKNRSIRWLCKCECGKEKIVKQKNLIEGITTNCGCLEKDLDLTNKKIGRLTVISFAYSKNKRKYWKCICECGNICDVMGNYLKLGSTKSCGCLKKELNQKGNIKHNMYKTRIYKIYQSMKQRCYFEKHTHYKNYGGRGISICDEWLGKNGFVNFYNWAMCNGYNDSLSIDRINNDGNYEPSNCKFSTNEEQQNNTRITKKYNYNGETLTLTQISRKYHINKSTLRHRIKKYNDINIAIEKPIDLSKKRH